MDQLVCVEVKAQPVACCDKVFLDDQRVLKNLVSTQQKYTINSSYFKCLQTDLEPYMRKVVASWMLEVCEEEGCQDDIFPLSMNILDRFLSCLRIRKSQLQLLGSVCLFLASKLRQTEQLSAYKLVRYADYSITIEELMNWELLVLSRLKWDLSAVTPSDFLNIFLRRLKNWSRSSETEVLIRKHAQTFIALCATEFEFSSLEPSLIASASIATAVHGLESDEKRWKKFLHILNDITGIEAIQIQLCVDRIEALISAAAALTIQADEEEAFVTNQLEVKHFVKYDTLECNPVVVNSHSNQLQKTALYY